MIPRTFQRNFLARGVKVVVQQPSISTASAAFATFDFGSPSRSKRQITNTQQHSFSSLSEPAYLNRPYKEVPSFIGERATAQSAWEKSCYFKIDFKVNENSLVYEAVQRFAAYNIGALAVTNDEGKVVGMMSERDYVCKVALLGRSSKNTKISEVATLGENIVVAKKSDSVDACMRKMLARDIRHLPVVDEESGEVVGLLSIKDLIKELTKEKDDVITKLSDFNLGKGAFFEHT
jgi:predicted transcriptional regulator